MAKSTLFAGRDGELTERIIGAYYNVYNEFGYRYPEVLCHRALKVELDYLQIPFKSEVAFSMFHRGVSIGDYRADLVVDSRVIVECKAVERIAATHVSQVVAYLKATGLRTGLVLNFGPEPDVRRVDR